MFAKTLAGVLALFIAGVLRFSFWGVVIFLAVSAWLYFSEGVERTSRRGYFLLLTVWAWAAGAAAASGGIGWPFVITFIIYAALIYAWLGDLRLLWSGRHVIAGLGETALFAASAVALFYLFPGVQTTSFWGDLGFLVSMFVVSAVLFNAAFRSFPERFLRRERLVTWGSALILTEAAALLVFLPLGFLNAAAVLTLVFIVLRDAVAAYFRGSLKTGLVFREITVLAVFLVIIFAVVPWALQ